MDRVTYFVSDLHLFCRRFDGERFWNKLFEVSKQATAVVLGGDIFDFRWTTFPTIEDSANEAIRRLASLVETNRQCEFHYLLGNHDYHESFVPRLERLAHDESNLSCHPYYLRLGNSLFLHGDVATRTMGTIELETQRRRWLQMRKKGRVANWLYDWSVRVVGVVPGSIYVVAYTVVLLFAMARNALAIPYSWLVRPRFFVYIWFVVETYYLPGTVDYVLWLFNALLAIKVLTGFVKIRRRI